MSVQNSIYFRLGWSGELTDRLTLPSTNYAASIAECIVVKIDKYVNAAKYVIHCFIIDSRKH